ncbi:hypothetical protein BC941DRAFT_436996 [Chlamydoabsidia padenii]|nr:hypothetical protein BC941DRAFT_436996 [Chlamydoabsidia padenii]
MPLSSKEALKRISERLQTDSSHHIPSPITQPRRACVALILRWRSRHPDLTPPTPPKTFEEFFDLPWVKEDGQVDLLFMQRATRTGDRWSGHVAYFGGKNEAGETDLDTVVREVQEESGLNLASDAFIQLGRLDDRELISTFNKQLMMILVPFVFLQVVPITPNMRLEKDEVASVEWIPLNFFLSPIPNNTHYAEESLTPRIIHGWRRQLLQPLLGTVSFPAIDLPIHSTSQLPDRRFRLWGLTLAMTRDLIQLTGHDELPFLALVAATPRYSRRDIGWWIKCITAVSMFWQQKVTSLSKSQQQAQWEKLYYGSMRLGLMMAMATRAVALVLGVSWLLRRFQ